MDRSKIFIWLKEIFYFDMWTFVWCLHVSFICALLRVSVLPFGGE